MRRHAVLESNKMILRGLFAALLLSLSVAANAATWRSSGPGGLRVNVLARSSTQSHVWYAISPHGIFRSEDDGVTWEDRTGSLTSVNLIAVDPTNPDRVYVTRRPEPSWSDQLPRVFRSMDGGLHWQGLVTGLPQQYPFLRPHSLLINPRNPNVLYVAGECEGFGWCAGAGVFKSLDGGDTWSRLAGLAWPVALSLDPADPDVLYENDAVTGSARSNDAGTTWTYLTSAVPSRQIVSDAFDPMRRYGIGSGPLLMVSFDAGAHWSGDEVRLLSEQTIDRWLDAVLDVDRGRGRLFLGTSSGVFGTQGGLFRSGDGGRRWLPIEGAGHQPIFSVIFDRATNAVTIATRTGLYRTSNLGREWSELRVAVGGEISRVATHPGVPGRLYATTLTTLFQSDDFGQSWFAASELPRESNDHGVEDLIVDAAGDVYIAFRWSSRVMKFSEKLQQWSSIQVAPHIPFPVTSSFLVADPQTAGTIYADGRITRDGGITWQTIAMPRTTRSLAIDPQDSRRLFAWSFNEVFRSDDGGNSWIVVARDISVWSNVTISRADSNVVTFMARTHDERPALAVYRSIDGGEHWSVVVPSGATLPFDVTITSHPRQTDTLYAATADGVFRSDDGGATWHSEGLTNRPTHRAPIVIDAAGAFLHVGTDRGVWETALDGARRRAVRR